MFVEYSEQWLNVVNTPAPTYAKGRITLQAVKHAVQNKFVLHIYT